MPIYEYHCDTCARDSEVFVRNRSQKLRCPECGSTRLQRRLSAFAAGKAGVKTPTPSCSGNPKACGRCSN